MHDAGTDVPGTHGADEHPSGGHGGSDHHAGTHGADEHPALTFADYVRTLLPWAAYIAGTHAIGSWKYGFIIGTGVAAAIVVNEIAHRQSRFMDLGTLLFCVCMTAAALYNAKSILKTYNLPLSLAFIGLLSAVSLLMRSPFTYRCHRDHLPDAALKSTAAHEVIYRRHVTATAVWAISELLAGGASALLILNHHGGWAIAVQIAGTLVPMGYTRFTHERIHSHPEVRVHLAAVPA